MRRILAVLMLLSMSLAQAGADACAMGSPIRVGAPAGGADGGHAHRSHALHASAVGGAAPAAHAQPPSGGADAVPPPHPHAPADDGCGTTMSCAPVIPASASATGVTALAPRRYEAAPEPRAHRSAELYHITPPPRPLA